ncbi:hypothetical protein F9L33_14655 [Amylibacter sp. SFDW26]|uniref:hypothetical protein n=1 Tax=Amylibacter sp. SFDW26 TaxID=2652722 RepID=UPI00126234B9|nr:hypothetical protein [Amylibacter sp. SFDW26]KAB7610133.1 hypothetical protein F9L33_14655 [Amylibacter sp. SFDW26]
MKYLILVITLILAPDEAFSQSKTKTNLEQCKDNTDNVLYMAKLRDRGYDTDGAVTQLKLKLSSEAKTEFGKILILKGSDKLYVNYVAMVFDIGKNLSPEELEQIMLDTCKENHSD